VKPAKVLDLFLVGVVLFLAVVGWLGTSEEDVP
jgi:hypothetical protein